MIVSREALHNQALLAYIHALLVLDPVRFRFWGGCGLTMPQLRLMFVLREENDVPASRLAERMQIAPSTVTGLTDRLFRDGFISRRNDPQDRRVVRVCLTDEGARIVEEVDNASRAYLYQVFQRMEDKEVEQLIGSLECLADASRALQAEQQVTSSQC